MTRTLNATLQPLDTTIPDPALIVLIGPAGSGKTTLASTWAPTQVLCLDQYRALVSDQAGDQNATGDAVLALHSVLEARLSRGLTSIVDATNCEKTVRAGLVQTARRYSIPTVAMLMAAPLPVCLERNAARPADRRVPENIVRAQHRAAVDSHPHLHDEGFDHVVFAPSIDRLSPLLARGAANRRAELGWDGGQGLGNELLLRRFFGPDIARLAQWKDHSILGGGDRIVELRAGAGTLTLALRLDTDGEGDIGFDVLVACPAGEDNLAAEACPGPAWVPVYSAIDLHRAHLGELDNHEDLQCAHCGYRGDSDHEASADQNKDAAGNKALTR
ncbi:AAA family ATPase [Streptomyces zaomyceticus]|uniref:AAA family ATPase n=1 Tax=Streptomyces zaomyceticus TaxID=68286 RepID=UPI0036776EFB